MAKTIPLTQGQVCIVDDEDYEILNKWKWYATWSQFTRSYYAARNGREKPRKHILMHREILGLKHGDKRQGDHVESGQTLDNRRVNLRIATREQNCANARLNRDSTTGLKGVTWHKGSKKFRARITVHGKQINLGDFDDKQLAYSTYCEAVAKYHGEFGRTR
jgi:hypothetical protein